MRQLPSAAPIPANTFPMCSCPTQCRQPNVHHYRGLVSHLLKAVRRHPLALPAAQQTVTSDQTLGQAHGWRTKQEQFPLNRPLCAKAGGPLCHSRAGGRHSVLSRIDPPMPPTKPTPPRHDRHREPPLRSAPSQAWRSGLRKCTDLCIR
jgi:hypothetical protein